MAASRTSRSQPLPLTERQIQLLHFCAAGFTEPQIAARVGLTRETIKMHLFRARQRLGAANTTHAVVLAIGRGALDLQRLPDPRFHSRPGGGHAA